MKDFVEKILVKRLNVTAIVVGDDFRFGAQRAGDYALLQKLAHHYCFETLQIPTVIYNNKRVSSTRIRLALEHGDLKSAQALLGRPYSLYGKVIHGNKLGRTLGYPTANINLHRNLVPLLGVFAVRVHNLSEKPVEGVAHIGTRSIIDSKRVLLEVYLFNFNQTIYGKNLHIEFLYKLRNGEHYDSLEGLRVQIREDIEKTKQFFSLKNTV